MTPEHDHGEIKALLLENKRLLTENNEILKKLHKGHVQALWLKGIWFVLIVVAPMILVYYFIAPMYSSMSGRNGNPALQMEDIAELTTLLQDLQKQ